MHCAARHFDRGLSPRGRGKPPKGDYNGQDVRSIPAWAGETHNNALKCMYSEVYPRVGGGNGNRGTGKPNG